MFFETPAPIPAPARLRVPPPAFRVMKALLFRLEEYAKTLPDQAEASQPGGAAADAKAPEAASAAAAAANPLLSWASGAVSGISAKVGAGARAACPRACHCHG